MTENNYEDVEREAIDDQEPGGLDASKAADLKAVFDTAWQDGRRPERQCTAHRTNGDPCRRAAINGGTVCATHGGRSPQVKAKARVRLEMAADRMAKELLKIAVSDDAPDTVKLNAIKDALDRAGLSAKTAVEVEVGPSKAFEDVLGAVLSGGSRAASRAERGVPDDEDPNRDWLEGEIVDAQTTDLNDEAPAPRPRPREEPAIPTSRDTGLMDMETALAQLRATTPPPAPTGTRRGRTK